MRPPVAISPSLKNAAGGLQNRIGYVEIPLRSLLYLKYTESQIRAMAQLPKKKIHRVYFNVWQCIANILRIHDTLL